MAAGIDDGTADLMVASGVLVVDEDRVTGRAGTTDHRTGVVGAAIVDDVTGHFTHAVQHASNGQLAVVRRGVVGGEVEDIRLNAGVAGLVGRIDGEVVISLADTGGRRVTPRAIGVRHHRAQHGAVVVDGDLRVGFGLARQGRGRVVRHAMVGDRALDRTDIVQYLVNGRLERSHCVDAESERYGRSASVASFVRRSGDDAVRPLPHIRNWCEAPGAIDFNRGAAQFDSAIGDFNDATNLPGTLDLGTGIVSDAIKADVAGDAADIVNQVGNRDQHLGGIHNHVQRAVLTAAVAGLVQHFRAERMVAIGQRGGRREAPLAIGTYIGLADCLAVVVDDDLAIRLGSAAEHRTVVIGGITRMQRASHRTHIVSHRQAGHISRCRGVDAEVPDSGRAANQPHAIGRSRNYIVRTISQDTCGDFPLAIAICRRTTDQGIAVVQLDDTARIRRPLEGRLVVVGHVAFLQEAGIRPHIVEDAFDGWHSWPYRHQGDTVLVARRGLVARHIHLNSGQVVDAGNQRK